MSYIAFLDSYFWYLVLLVFGLIGIWSYWYSILLVFGRIGIWSYWKDLQKKNISFILYVGSPPGEFFEKKTTSKTKNVSF